MLRLDSFLGLFMAWLLFCICLVVVVCVCVCCLRLPVFAAFVKRWLGWVGVNIYIYIYMDSNQVDNKQQPKAGQELF